jgi:hypothetical protein
VYNRYILNLRKAGVIMEEFATRIKELREEKGYSQRYVEEQTGISHSIVFFHNLLPQLIKNFPLYIGTF